MHGLPVLNFALPETIILNLPWRQADHNIVRITGGKYKGRNIHCPPGTIRPAMDRMRESFFSVLGNIEGISFLDLFSGSGIMALEAASRGAERVHAVEKDARKRDMLRHNLSIAGDVCTMSLMPAESFIARHRQPFSIVFADPPFLYRHKNDLLQRLINSHLLSDGSKVCLHFPSENTMSNEFVRDDNRLMMSCQREKSYGRSLIRFYHVQTGASYSEGGEHRD